MEKRLINSILDPKYEYIYTVYIYNFINIYKLIPFNFYLNSLKKETNDANVVLAILKTSPPYLLMSTCTTFLYHNLNVPCKTST